MFSAVNDSTSTTANKTDAKIDTVARALLNRLCAKNS
jgi:hypothetical protein